MAPNLYQSKGILIYKKLYVKHIMSILGIDGFLSEVTDFEIFRHCRKMMCHSQTGQTTDKFHIPEHGGTLAGNFLL